MGNNSRAKVTLLIGKVACGKTTFARNQQKSDGTVFLSVDELHLSVFGQNPTREELDSSHTGTRNYLKGIALAFLRNDIDVNLDWGFWSKSSRNEVSAYFSSLGYEVILKYFDIPLDVRLHRNLIRNASNDVHSFKIEQKDIELFDSFFEEPSDDENCERVYS
ncbi:hypothetical protein BCU68_12410 [Vibrio sp. 10N.286.49.B3]|uniref:ATP-binding protein n=1 Tax=Vibrio sp. 10N.286.49.B3 TaxID=1880855 RepID=UPI000C84F28D|nr:ATP-binding protein [Vibrio sp. 10N.286.49.B3]PMH44644.1 hypothetical protein BCU68_12410 [Vibrio sp. 10N.286.49.B3]